MPTASSSGGRRRRLPAVSTLPLRGAIALLSGGLLLWAAGGCSGRAGPPTHHRATGVTTGGEGGQGASGGAADDSDTAAGGRAARVPLIDEALDGQCEGGEPLIEFPSYLAPGDDLHRVTVRTPTAVCNDGSAAVIYVRPASDEVAANHWVLYLEEGKSCYADYETCASRWCGTGPLNRSLMSTTLAPESIGGRGIFSQRPDNGFRSANQVFFYYCSSDVWVGQASDVALRHPDDPTLQYRIHFRGHSIIDAALSALQAGGLVSDDGHVTMPALGHATRVLLTGASAGSQGLVHNGDWMAARLPAGADVALVFDTGCSPAPDFVSNPVVYDAKLAAAEFRWTVDRVVMNGFFDTSCLPSLPAGQPESLCGLASHVRTHHVTTPYFVRRDLLDPVGVASWVGQGGTEKEFYDALVTMMVALPDLPSYAIEGAAMTRSPGVYGPGCGQHIGLNDDTAFLDVELGDGAGHESSYHDALVSWLGGAGLALVDELPPARSHCPAAAGAGGGG